MELGTKKGLDSSKKSFCDDCMNILLRRSKKAEEQPLDIISSLFVYSRWQVVIVKPIKRSLWALNDENLRII